MNLGNEQSNGLAVPTPTPASRTDGRTEQPFIFPSQQLLPVASHRPTGVVLILSADPPAVIWRATDGKIEVRLAGQAL